MTCAWQAWVHAITATCAHCFKHAGRGLALEPAPQRSPVTDKGASPMSLSTPPSEALAPGSWVLHEALEPSGRAWARKAEYNRGNCPFERALRHENASLRRALWPAEGEAQQAMAGCLSPMCGVHGPCRAPRGHAGTTYDIQVITGDCEVSMEVFSSVLQLTKPYGHSTAQQKAAHALGAHICLHASCISVARDAFAACAGLSVLTHTSKAAVHAAIQTGLPHVLGGPAGRKPRHEPGHRAYRRAGPQLGLAAPGAPERLPRAVPVRHLRQVPGAAGGSPTMCCRGTWQNTWRNEPSRPHCIRCRQQTGMCGSWQHLPAVDILFCI